MGEIRVHKREELKDEPTITFKLISDKTSLFVGNVEATTTLVEISGYDLQINFNMEYLRSVEDIEMAVEGIGDLFRREIMNKLLEYQNQPETK